MDSPKHEVQEELQQLREENTRLKALLTRCGIIWEEAAPDSTVSKTLESTPVTNQFTTSDKIALFRRLFRGCEDVYSQRWKSAKGTSGYSPACSNEWKPGICHKPRIKCGDCNQRLLLPMTDQVIYDHLTGKQTIGVYPLLTDDSCYFLAVDFDESDWREDASAFMTSCHELKISAALEISRSGNGAHVWIFFSEPVQAREARELGAVLISHTCNRNRQLSLASGNFSLQSGHFPGKIWRIPCYAPVVATTLWMWLSQWKKITTSPGNARCPHPPELPDHYRNPCVWC